LQQILACSADPEEYDIDDFYGDKLTKSQFLKAQLELDVITSEYSQEQKQVSSYNAGNPQGFLKARGSIGDHSSNPQNEYYNSQGQSVADKRQPKPQIHR